MENASKALIMAAEILIGVMIISIGVYLFKTMGEYSAATTAEIEETQIATFNQQFLKYYGTAGPDKEGDIEPIRCTIHEIVGLANLANKLNIQNGIADVGQASDNTSYIQIDLKIGTKTYKNLEAMDQSELVQLVKDNSIVYTTGPSGTTAETKYFKCVEEPGINSNTKLVNYMKFVEF